MKVAIYPGSFDPMTLGHLNIIRRASRIFDKVVVCIMVNGSKDRAMFTPEQRVDMARRVTAHLPNVEIDYYNGLLAEYARRFDHPVIVKGLRASMDFENEFTMASINKKLNPDMETMFLTASDKYTFVSSSNVKEIARHGGDLRDFMPRELIDEVTEMARKEK
ncbi:MAG: pantetheine-phosphate adenylyltransferase [Oscillospiraceae bacterium]|nr:pantetheine-phosphate adenylyltransferase [Oscillospiraceae bacterium]